MYEDVKSNFDDLDEDSIHHPHLDFSEEQEADETPEFDQNDFVTSQNLKFRTEDRILCEE